MNNSITAATQSGSLQNDVLGNQGKKYSLNVLPFTNPAVMVRLNRVEKDLSHSGLEDCRMTEYQKRRIMLMRQNRIGYTAIANALKLSVSTVKTYCRRNNLQSEDLAVDTQPDNNDASAPAMDLISVQSRGNNTTAKQSGGPRVSDIWGHHPVCDVTLSFADEPDDVAIADVLELLLHANYEG